MVESEQETVTFVEPCSCSGPGECSRMRQRMTWALWERCQADAKFRAAFEAAQAKAIIPDLRFLSERARCKHRGKLLRIDEFQTGGSCGGCRGAIRVEAFACSSSDRNVPECSPAECNECKHYAAPDVPYPFTGPVTRHLAYHLCPISGNGIWQRNVAQLRKRWSVFTGRKRISIVTGNVTDRDGRPARFDSPSTVRREFDGLDAEFITVENKFPRGEGQSFVPLLEPLIDTDPNSITFYAHSKGVGRPPRGNPISQWVALMYSACLDYVPLVENQLQRFQITGPFRIPGRTWFYSGAFFWLRNYHLLYRNWKHVGDYWGCVEIWPRTQFQITQSGCIFWDRNANLYDANTMAMVRKSFAGWSCDNVKYRTRGMTHASRC